MGKNADIAIKRVGAGKASVLGNFDFQGVVDAKKGLKINGVDCKCTCVRACVYTLRPDQARNLNRMPMNTYRRRRRRR